MVNMPSSSATNVSSMPTDAFEFFGAITGLIEQVLSPGDLALEEVSSIGGNEFPAQEVDGAFGELERAVLQLEGKQEVERARNAESSQALLRERRRTESLETQVESLREGQDKNRAAVSHLVSKLAKYRHDAEEERKAHQAAKEEIAKYCHELAEVQSELVKAHESLNAPVYFEKDNGDNGGGLAGKLPAPEHASSSEWRNNKRADGGGAVGAAASSYGGEISLSLSQAALGSVGSGILGSLQVNTSAANLLSTPRRKDPLAHGVGEDGNTVVLELGAWMVRAGVIGGTRAVVVITGRDYENSDHSGEGVEDDGVSSTMSRGSLLRGENTCAVPINRAPPAVVVPASSGTGRGSGDGGGGRNSNRSGGGGGVLGGLTGGGGGRSECKIGRDEGDGGVSMGVNEVRPGANLEELDSSARSTDGLIGSSFLNSYGDHAAGGDGVEVSERSGRVKGRARGPGGPRHPRIRPTLERGASPASTPRNLPRAASGDDSGGLGGAEFLSSPEGTRLLDAFRSPLSEATATGSGMTEAAKLTSSVRFGSVGDIQAILNRAEKSLLVERDGEGASLLMHAAQRGETDVFRSVLDFLAAKLTPTEVLAEFCAQDEDGQMPLLFAARSGSGEVFRHALEALLARATPQKVLQELTAKERGDWTPLMAAAGSGSVECFQEVLRAIAERTSEERVMNELMTKDNGGWTPLVFAFQSGNRGVFVAAMQAFLERGEGGPRRLKEQLLSSQDEGKGCLLEAAATAGWFTRGPQMSLSTLELIDSSWDNFERSLDSRWNITVERGAFEHAMRYQDLTGISCLLSHGCGINAMLIERLVEACGPRSVRDFMFEAAASARNPLVSSLGLLKTLLSSEASCPLHATWFSWMRAALEKLILQVLANLPVSARALNKRVAPAGGTSIFGRMNSDASGGLINNTTTAVGGSSALHHHRRHRLLRPTAATTAVAGGGGNVSGSLSHSSSFNHGRGGSTHHLQITNLGGGGGGTRGSGVSSGTVRRERERERELGGSGGVGSSAASASTCMVPVGDGTRKGNYGNYYGQYGGRGRGRGEHGERSKGEGESSSGRMGFGAGVESGWHAKAVVRGPLGGSASIEGLGDRLEQELKAMLPKDMANRVDVRVPSPAELRHRNPLTRGCPSAVGIGAEILLQREGSTGSGWITSMDWAQYPAVLTPALAYFGRGKTS